MTTAVIRFSDDINGPPDATVYVHGDASRLELVRALKITESAMRLESLKPGLSHILGDSNRAAAWFIKMNPYLNTFVYNTLDIPSTGRLVSVGCQPKMWKVKFSK